MTVSTEVSREEYTGNGVTTDFDYRFRVFSADELVVTVADTTENIRTLVLNTDYTVTGAGSRNGGKVKLASALANNWRISIERELPVTQETDVRNQGNFFPEVHEDAWDKLTMLIQQAIGGLGLALRKPNWLAKHYDAKGNRIANMADPVASQDAATKGYVDSVGDGLFKKTLRFPENVEAMPPASSRSHSLQGYTAEGRPVPVFSMTDTADLALKLASNSGAGLVGINLNTETYQTGTVGGFAAQNFKHAQHIQHYYDMLGDWDEAIFQAQLNIYLKGYSPKLIFPSAVITLNRPILGGVALGDYIHARHPELNFYDANTGQYKATWPLILHGVFRKHQDGGMNEYNGTQLIFSGCSDRLDRTWQNYGVIHCAPTEIAQFKQTAPVLKNWMGFCDIRDINVRSINKDGSRHGLCHGVVVFNGTQCYVHNVSVFQIYGAGILYDWSWDYMVDNCKFIQCGRMSPTWNEWWSAGNTGYKYQTYAPIHVIRSRSDDNSNFCRFKNIHVEDNYYAVADIIVSGNSSPVWLEDCHFETDSGTGVASINGKLVAGLGNFGITYFGQDSEPGFDYKNIPDTKTGGFLLWRGGSMYATGYGTGTVGGLLFMTRFSGASLENINVPHSADIWVAGGNAAPYITIQNCSLRDIRISGGNSHPSPLRMDNCDCRNITVDFASAIRLSNVRGTGSLTYTNRINTSPSNVTVLDNVSFTYINATLSYAMGTVQLTSTTTPSSLLVTRGNVEIADYAWFRNSVGGE